MSGRAAPAPGGRIGRTDALDWGLDPERLRVGISLGGVSSAGEAKTLLRWVELAEALGLHSVWIPEMHFAPGVATSPLLLLAACAARSRHLRLGTTSLLLPTRPPLRLAEEVAALDRLSGGRVILGLGRGFRPPLFAAFGIDARTKRDRFDAALDLMLARWAGLPVSLEGTAFEGEADPGDARDPGAALPLQTPHPPLAVAAFGRKGLLQAARRGLPYLASPLEPLSLVEENLAYHAQHLPSEPSRAGRVVPVMRTVYAAGCDAEAARVHAGLERELRRTRASGSRVPAALERAARAEVHERAIVGTTSCVVDQVSRYRERLGVQLLVARPQVADTTPAEREAALERLALEVLPQVV